MKIQSTLQKSRSVAAWSWRLGEVELINRGMKKLLREMQVFCLDCGDDYKYVYIVKIHSTVYLNGLQHFTACKLYHSKDK